MVKNLSTCLSSSKTYQYFKLSGIAEKDIIQFSTNSIPKGLVPLEELFDNNDVAKCPGVKPNNEEVHDVNIGTEQDPKVVKVTSKLPQEIKEKYIQLLQKNVDVFVWSYEDLKFYDTDVIKHTIPLKENENYFKKKLRRLNPLLYPMIEKDIKKLFEAKIIVSLRHSKRLENVIPMRKKNGEIRICIDFKNLNRVSHRDNYPLPKMDHILQRVLGSQRLSMLDGFSGYNQI